MFWLSAVGILCVGVRYAVRDELRLVGLLAGGVVLHTCRNESQKQEELSESFLILFFSFGHSSVALLSNIQYQRHSKSVVVRIRVTFDIASPRLIDPTKKK